jgi:hypothetical protein
VIAMSETLLVVAVFGGTVAGVLSGAIIVLGLDLAARKRFPASPGHGTEHDGEWAEWRRYREAESRPLFEAEAEEWARQHGRPEMAGPLARRMRTVRGIARTRDFLGDDGSIR